jgi:hypothetical protein
MKFSLTGTHNTFDATVVWHDGKLEGPDDLVHAIEREAHRLEGEPVHANDADDVVYSTADHLLNPHSAREIIRSQFDPTSSPRLEVLEGAFPPAPRFRTRLHERE